MISENIFRYMGARNWVIIEERISKYVILQLLDKERKDGCGKNCNTWLEIEGVREDNSKPLYSTGSSTQYSVMT